MDIPIKKRLPLSSLTFVSGNESKRQEYAGLLGIPNIKTVDPNFEEPQSLDLGNLVEAKIRRVQNLVSAPFFVEHTGLFISGWNDFPGGLSSELMKRVGAAGLCRMLSAYSDAERTARAQVAIGYYHPEHHIRIFRGEVTGRIALTPRGEQGFGWDSIFIPEEGDGRTYGQMYPAEKNRTSMRRRAIEAFRPFLKEHFEDAPVLKGIDQASGSRDEVFISYSHDDDPWFERLRTMLAPVVRNESIKLWSDRDISPGQTWQREIQAALSRAKVAVLLVSPKFLASEFIMEEELPYLLEAAEPGGTVILWVLLSQCLYQETLIGTIQAAHRPLQPLDALPPSALNATLAEIATAIAKAARA
jgi:non-canonical purine NTP pyrophosphatase (RdgB/HAM1 family)